MRWYIQGSIRWLTTILLYAAELKVNKKLSVTIIGGDSFVENTMSYTAEGDPTTGATVQIFRSWT